MNEKQIEIIYSTPPLGEKCTVINLGSDGLLDKISNGLTRHNATRAYVYIIGSNHFLAILDSDRQAPNA